MIGRLLACCVIGVAATASGQTWAVSESAALRVISDVSPTVTTEVLVNLARTQSMLRQMAGAESQLPLRVFALKNQQSLNELAPQRLRRGDIHTFGFSHAGPHAAFIALRTDRPAALTTETLRHEYAHVLAAAVFPDAPAWLDEGVADFWSSIAVEGNRLVAGRPIARHLELLRSRKWLPLNDVLKQPRGSLPSKPGHVAMFYAQAWAMVHYLLIGQDAGGPVKFMPSIDTLPAQFDSTIRQYVDTGRFGEAVVAWQRPADPTAVSTTMGEARALAERANMLVSGEQPRLALALARKALALDPQEPLALEVTGTYYFVSNQPGPARAWLTRALATGAGSHAAAIYMALLSTSPGDRERYLAAAVETRPNSDVAWQHLSAIFRADGRLEKARRWCHGWLNQPSAWLSLAHTGPCLL